MTLSIIPEMLLASNMLGFYVSFSPMIYLFIELVRNIPKFKIVPQLIPSWLVVSALMITIIGVGGLYHSDDAKPGDYVLLFTLVILIFYTYYTYSLAVISAKGPALLEVQREHTKDLKKFLDSWLNTLEYRRNFDVEFSEDYKRYFSVNEKIERDLMYDDFINHHIPNKYKGEADLKTYWENYKRDRNVLELKSYELYTRLYNEVGSTLGIDDHTAIYFIVRDIYRIYFAVNSGKYCHKPKIERAEKSQESFDTIYYFDEIDPECRVANVYRTSKDPDKAISNFNKMISDANIRTYNGYVDEMIMISSNLQDNEKRLKESISDLIKWPLFPGTTCDMLKDFELNN